MIMAHVPLYSVYVNKQCMMGWGLNLDCRPYDYGPCYPLPLHANKLPPLRTLLPSAEGWADFRS